MRLLEVNSLQSALERHLSTANRVDVAVAWATSSKALSALQKAAARGVMVRAIVGLAGNFSQPMALRTLQQIGELRIADGAKARGAPGGFFHPKVFIFRASGVGATGWIGSANLSDGGFSRNLEAVWETKQADSLMAWFEKLWDALPPDPTGDLERYAKQWRQPLPARASAVTRKSAGTARPHISNGLPANWSAYMAALEAADAYWAARAPMLNSRFSVLGEAFSWFETIQTVGSLVRRPSWSDFSDLDRWTLLGVVEKTGAWGLLGSMKRATRAKQLFGAKNRSDKLALERLRKAMVPFIEAQGTRASIDAATECLSVMGQEEGISHGVATRLMACARPDIAISINGGSAPMLSRLTGLPETPSSLASPRNYRKLLKWISSQPWHRSPEPADAWQAMVWNMRAALVDCFVYEPVISD